MQNDLWQRLREFRFDKTGAKLTFAARLADENGWPGDYAERVIEEYRRFLYLCVRAGHAVTPSDQVDQVWHLHLAYTRSYWDDLCGRVLQRPLHHGPTEGGEDEEAKYRDWYEHTLMSYRRTFGEEPPTDIWPPADIRFGQSYIRVLRKRKPRMGRQLAIYSAPVVIGAAVMGGVAGCSETFEFNEHFGVLVFIVILFVVVIASWGRKSGRADGGGCSGGWFGGTGCGSDGGGCGSGCGGGGCGGGGD